MPFSSADRSLGGDAARAPWRQRLQGLVAFVAWLAVAVALASHRNADPGFTTTGGGGPVLNLLGRAGAWTSDLLLAACGLSAAWLPVVGLLQALRTLAGRTSGAGDGAEGNAGAAAVSGSASASASASAKLQGPRWPRLRFSAGVVALLCASAALEWTRLYGLESRLPGGHSGGVLGYVLGPLSMHWLGFTGSGVLWIALLVLGMSGALKFSWPHVADAIGGWIDGRREHRAVERERAEDERIGEQAQRERELSVEEERLDDLEHAPIVIEPEVVQVTESKRVQRERQKPLFRELADTRLPQVDLLDVPPARVESVTPESLEMTSRLIEKKLGDFGVTVHVVAAAPG
ncbi:MAG TPA: DNA translocase FtsK 4TM domain-containing protein, partial [Burkholderiaceae bacterium]|nr:DNA translocase FtsK 4TM domain-containing protein [Burkholderiaceae bacterium]